MIKRKRQGNIIKDNVYKIFEYYAVKIVYSTDAHRRRERDAHCTHTLNTTGQTFVFHTVFTFQSSVTIYLLMYLRMS